MSAFYDWFDTAPLWVQFAIVFIALLAVTGATLAWVAWLTGRRP